MAATTRIVCPELLDELAPSDPRACRSRRDLRRVHRALGSVSILRHAIMRLRLAVPPRRILELGGGDGSLVLRLAQAMKPRWRNVALTILDRHDLVSVETRAGYTALGWNLTVLREDVLDWAAESNPTHFDLCITCLFLHHFDAEALTILMPAIASNAHAFVACEPRRNAFARVGSGLIGLLGTNRVTREDAAKSVVAGFTERELMALWPRVDAAWICEEYSAPPFTHCFTAVLNGLRHG
jgi:SAM-dependent methyltransferase